MQWLFHLPTENSAYISMKVRPVLMLINVSRHMLYTLRGEDGTYHRKLQGYGSSLYKHTE